MVCSLHSVTTGSRDRSNVSLIIIIIIITTVSRWPFMKFVVVNYDVLYFADNLLMIPTSRKKTQENAVQFVFPSAHTATTI